MNYSSKEVLEVLRFIKSYVPQEIRGVDEGNFALSKLIFVIKQEMKEIEKNG